MKRIVAVVSGVLVFVPMFSLATETHMQVQAALDWQLPVNECNKPKIAAAEHDVFDPLQDTKIRFDPTLFEVLIVRQTQR